MWEQTEVSIARQWTVFYARAALAFEEKRWRYHGDVYEPGDTTPAHRIPFTHFHVLHFRFLWT